MPESPDDKARLETERERLQARIAFLSDHRRRANSEPSTLSTDREHEALVSRLAAVQQRINRLESRRTNPDIRNRRISLEPESVVEHQTARLKDLTAAMQQATESGNYSLAAGLSRQLHRMAESLRAAGTPVDDAPRYMIVQAPSPFSSDFAAVPFPDLTEDDEPGLGEEIIRAAAVVALDNADRAIVQPTPEIVQNVTVSTNPPPRNESNEQSPCEHSTCRGLNFCAEAMRSNAPGRIHPGVYPPPSNIDVRQLSRDALRSELLNMFPGDAPAPGTLARRVWADRTIELRDEIRRRNDMEYEAEAQAARAIEANRIASQLGAAVPMNVRQSNCPHPQCQGWVYCRETVSDRLNQTRAHYRATTPSAPGSDYVAPLRDRMIANGFIPDPFPDFSRSRPLTPPSIEELDRRMRELLNRSDSIPEPERIFAEPTVKPNPEKALRGKAQMKAIIEMLDHAGTGKHQASIDQRATSPCL